MMATADTMLVVEVADKRQRAAVIDRGRSRFVLVLVRKRQAIRRKGRRPARPRCLALIMMNVASPVDCSCFGVDLLGHAVVVTDCSL